MTNQHLGRAIGQGLAAAARAGTARSCSSTAARCTTICSPDPTLAKYSFGRAIHALTHGDYREVDLYVPELVDTTPALRAEPWYAAWRPGRKAEGTTLVRRQPRSAVLLFEDAAPPRKKHEK